MTRMLITRPEPDASLSAVRLQALGIEPVVVPLLQRVALPEPLPPAEGFAALALTSSNALRTLEERGALAAYRHLPAFAVGDGTAETARLLGFDRVTSAGGSFADLVAVLAQGRPGGPVFYPCARHAVGDLGKSLSPFGIAVATTRLYDMVPIGALPEPVRAELRAGLFDAALFYSRRTAETFASLADGIVPREARTRIGMLCLSENIAVPLIEAHFVRVSLADHPSEDAMMTLALSFARDQNAS